jgi:hypothetical protein
MYGVYKKGKVMTTRTQIYLDDRQLRELKIRAQRANTTVSDLIRKGVALVLDENTPENNKDPFLRMIGRIKGGKHDSVSIDTVVYGKE